MIVRANVMEERLRETSNCALRSAVRNIPMRAVPQSRDRFYGLVRTLTWDLVNSRSDHNSDVLIVHSDSCSFLEKPQSRIRAFEFGMTRIL